MATLTIQSHFAGLMIEEDEMSAVANESQKKKTKTVAKKAAEPIKSNTCKSNIKTKVQAPAKKKKGKANPATADQWEQWKQKDEQFVDGNYETELQQAICLSKLDFEEKKNVYKQIKKEADVKNKVIDTSSRGTTKKDKQKKKNVMSLDQFNDMINVFDEPKLEPTDTIEGLKNPETDTQFFNRIDDEVKSELIKEKHIETVKNRLENGVSTRLQFAAALERKDEDIKNLKQEVLTLKQELLKVKIRNKKLCNILGQGEMKDKAEVLVEVERLRGVQAELTAEMASLHTELEKERSKNADPRARDKKNGAKKKSIRFDVSTEASLSKEASIGAG